MGPIERADGRDCEPWDRRADAAVYSDGRFTLGLENGQPRLIADGRRRELSCHPYEPCLYVRSGGVLETVIHNAFDPFAVLEAFARGKTVTAITGTEYGPREFCAMLAFAAGRFSDTDMSYVEGAMAVEKLEEAGALSPETAVDVKTLGVRRISGSFSHSKKLAKRVMYTGDGRAWLRVKK